MASILPTKKDVNFSSNILLPLSVILFFATYNVIAIELYQPCDLRSTTACEEYNTSAVICLPIPNNPSEAGICNCKWNIDFPDEYDYDEEGLNCIALVGGHCTINNVVEPRPCTDNAVCKPIETWYNVTERCECEEGFMEDGLRRCTERTLDHGEFCVINNQTVGFNCKSGLECLRKDNRTSWCECKGNEEETTHIFINDKCLPLVNAPCSETNETYPNPCYRPAINHNSTFCDPRNNTCQCNSGYVANEFKQCIYVEPTDPVKFLDYNDTCIFSDSLYPCNNYSNTVGCIKNASYTGYKCLCLGNEGFPEGEYGYEFHEDKGKCLALLGSECEHTDCIQNAHCGTNESGRKVCLCDDGYEHVYYQRCDKRDDGYIIETSTTGTGNKSVANKFFALSLALSFYYITCRTFFVE